MNYVRMEKMPPWLGGWLAALLAVATFVLTGMIHAKALIVVWPVTGLVVAVLSFLIGFWNYDDEFGQQVFNFAMHIVVPPATVGMLTCDLLHFQRERLSYKK